MAFTGTIWAFEPVVALSEPAQRIMSNNVTARHHHRRIVIGGLLFRHRADKNGVKVISWGKGDFNLDTLAQISTIGQI